MRRTVLLKIAGVAVAALIGLTGCAGGRGVRRHHSGAAGHL
ncbi:MAG TPA: hypothetical protein VK020_00635 [Microlunatus sp.]|nr:hypothetical protein [Microlunatus sp.]